MRSVRLMRSGVPTAVSYTHLATPREHVALVVKAINDGMGHTTDWKVGTVEGAELIRCV